RSDFSISVDQLQWALNAYNIAIAAVLLVGVAIGDRLGHRKVYELGLLIFVIGSILCALSGNIMSLIVARVVEGVGASVITPMSMAILTANVPVESRGKALGIWSGIGGLALIVGPALGGIIVAKIAWQWIFWINVPIGLICILLSQQKLPETKAGSQKINVLDSLLVVLTSAGLIWALSASKSVKIPTAAIIVAVLSVLFALLLVWRQKREDFPL
ncbi:MAG TPA: MFS transporter, partial [Lactobacillus sp.]|nr:MFS transporter [Lactobacillus sp.]